MKKSIAFAAVAALLASMPIPQLAAPAIAKKADEICMAKKTKGRKSGDKEITVIAKNAKQGNLKARGFKKVRCKGNASHHTEYNREICKFAAIAPAVVQQDFKKVHGATPSELCSALK